MPSLREIDNREPAKAKRETALEIRPLAPVSGPRWRMEAAICFA